ncbi:Transposable element Tcb1 transposase [Oopsacas minuta]|uniref:Transposable element Tcb1 transposase n=1 Tax=Oopsacas minuta TaxID=111878 RepID=A0AAV7KHY0_9METZ|nr:Transposable element Tcb1 transposase [Oopsacas minuta]
MSDFIFMQDGAPAHTTKMTQRWCRDSLNEFWEKGDWPGNSPNLNPIEHLWAILKERVNEKGQMTNRNQLIETVKLAWQAITPDILENLVGSMPNRVKVVLEMGRDYINK